MSLKPTYDRSLALIIGLDDFKAAPPLQTARLGAEAVAQVLTERYKFDPVITLLDAEATRANIEDAQAELRSMMGQDDRFVIYWAGHGVGIEGRQRSEGFLVAYDSNLERRTRLIKMRDLADNNFTTAKHSLVILDTCHSGYAVTYEAPRALVVPPPDPRLAVKQFLTRQAYQVFASANPLQTATDAGLLDGHTPFTGYLLRALSGADKAAYSPINNLLTASSVAEYVRNGVAAFSGNWQGPQTGILPGDGGGVLMWELPDALDVLPERLRRALLSDSADTRYYALADAERLLGQPRYASALEEALRELALNDPDGEVRSRAVDVLLKARQIPEPAVQIVETEPQAAPVVQTPARPEPAPAVKPAQPPARKPFEPEMVPIPAGPFLMGSPKSDKLRFDDEPEQFELPVDYDYAIGKYPVTVGQYRAFIEAGGYREDRWWTDAGLEARAQGWDYVDSKWKPTGKPWIEPRYWKDKKWAGDDNLPVVGVSWHEVYAYTRWLAEATGRDYRLLSEAEWEKAARGGLQIPDGKGGMKKNPNPARIWPWGDDEPTSDLCNFNVNYQGGSTSPVTSHAAQAKSQPYGLYHMAGNVWEWCLTSWATPYQMQEDNDPAGDSLRVLRGGSWCDFDFRVRCSYRYWDRPVDRNDYFGFRVGGVVPVLGE